MGISCFRRARGNSVEVDDDRPRFVHLDKKSRVRRQGSGGSTLSQASTISNASISQLPPCSRASDPKIEAMMMPMPHDARDTRSSGCLRLSHPRIYGNLVADMKASKGCRDWRNFPVFGTDDVDMSITADEAARKKAFEYRQKVYLLNCSFDSGPQSSPQSDRSVSIDMIG